MPLVRTPNGDSFLGDQSCVVFIFNSACYIQISLGKEPKDNL